jgi:hypothetical protein
MHSEEHHLPGSAVPASAAAADLQTYQHINEHIHRATGDTNGFALVTTPPPPAGAAAAAEHSSGKDASITSNSSSSGSSGSCDLKQASRDTAGKQQQQQRSLPLLQATSITLAELMHRNDSKAGNNTAWGNHATDASFLSTNTGSAGKGALRRRKSHRLLNRPPNPQHVLATAGVKHSSSKDWEQLLTPLSWKLHQQQRDAAQQKQQQQQQQQLGAGGLSRAGSLASNQSAAAVTASSLAASSPFANTRGLTPAASIASVSSSSIYAGSSARAARLARLAGSNASPHRRSFELPGSAAGTQMSAVFGASKQHVSRMLREAGSVDPRGLYRMLSKGQGRLAVATSLAGALPGCVSEKLVQFVDASSSMTGVGLGGAAAATSSGYAANQNSVATGSRRTSVSGDGVGITVAGSCGSVEGEVCAVCTDKAPNVALAGCGHSLCCDCTRTIVGEGVGSRPPLCPFCRQAITGFTVVMPAAAYV